MPGPLKHWLAMNDAGVWGADPIGADDSVVLRSTEIRIDGTWDLTDPAHRHLSPGERVEKRLREGDLVVVKASGSAEHLGKTAIVNADVAALTPCFANFVQRLRPKSNADPRFIWYLLNSKLASDEMSIRGTTSTGLRNLNGNILGSLTFPGPPLDEQRAIADHLDAETARIDAVIAKKQRMVDLLDERARAAVARAVFRGLNPHAEMVDPGLDLVGLIPAHWRTAPLSSLCSFQAGKAHEQFVDDDGQFICVNSRFISTEGQTIKRSTHNFSPALHGDSLIVMSDLPNGRALGKAFFVDDERAYAVNQRVGIIRPRGINPKYVYYQVNRHALLLRHDNGSEQTHLSNSTFTKLPLVVPPADEQRAIVSHLDALMGGLNSASDSLVRQLDLLRERRQALITAAVTGEIDVPRAA